MTAMGERLCRGAAMAATDASCILDESRGIETGFRESVPALKCAGTAQAGTSARQVLAGDSN
jgi:hypothetical protein